jgi:hypothetical protein
MSEATDDGFCCELLGRPGAGRPGTLHASGCARRTRGVQRLDARQIERRILLRAVVGEKDLVGTP